MFAQLSQPHNKPVLGIAFLLSAMLWFVVPFLVNEIRRDHVPGDEFDRRVKAESEILDSLSTFRDLGFGIWTHAHQNMEESKYKYDIYVTLTDAPNALLWYVWYPVRVLGYHDFYLMVSVYLLEALSFSVNTLSQFPAPPGFIQYEPAGISYLFGMVTHSTHGMLSSRAAFSMLLVHSVVQQTMPRRPRLGYLFVVVYAVLMLGFLWSTHQMYTVSLVLNILAAFSVYHTSRVWIGLRTVVEKPVVLDTTNGGVGHHVEPLDATLRDDDDDDDERFTVGGGGDSNTMRMVEIVSNQAKKQPKEDTGLLTSP